MKQLVIPFPILLVVALLVCGRGHLFAASDVPMRPASPDHPITGVVTAVDGETRVTGPAAGSSRLSLKIGEVINVGDEVRVGKVGKIDILWDHRALVSLQEESSLSFQEPIRGQTYARLQQGSARIALSYSAGRMTDVFTLETPLAHVVTRGGIVEATVAGRDGQSFLSRLVATPPLATVRVLEGQARVEPIMSEEKPVSLKAGMEIQLKVGALAVASESASREQSRLPLPVRDEHRELPTPVFRQIISAQIGQVLDLEKGLFQSVQTGNETEQVGGSIKGTILATSIGIPVVAGTTASGLNVPSSVGVSTSQPVVVAPQIVSAGSLGPSQSGGLNTSLLLQQILDRVDNGGRGKGSTGSNSGSGSGKR